MYGVVVLAALGALACVQETEERSSPRGESFTIRAGESVGIEGTGIEVRFEDVLQDSRCPPAVECIRAGEAVVELSVAADGGEAHRLELEVPPGGGAEGSYEGHRIRIVSLEPPASATRRLERKDYVLELVVD